MKKLTAFVLALTMLILCLSALTACESGDDGNIGGDPPSRDKVDTIVVPEYKDYARGTVDFSEMTYTRPDVGAVTLDFNVAATAIESNELTYSEQLDLIYGLEDGYIDIQTMAAYANILSSKNTADEYWSGEYEYITTAYPAFSQAVENLFVAAAKSPHAESFERDYFGEGLIEEYADGGDYTDEIVALMEEEAALEADYSAVSTATVTVTYQGMTDTADNILAHYADTYGESSVKYKTVASDVAELYELAADAEYTDILVSLFKVRRLISDEFGYESYATFAYDTLYHDYSPEEFVKFAEDISKYVVPVYAKLSHYVFGQYSIPQDVVTKVELVNGTYDMLKEADSELYETYSYMLQHGLYDIEEYKSTRFSGSFTTYLDAYNAPYVFLSTNSSIDDYTTLCHEFGHFYDSYINYSSTTSLDLSEVSSQGLELLALTKFNGILNDKEINYLTIYEMENALSCLIFQGFYATFEHIAYKLEYDEISEESLNAAVSLAASKMSLNSSAINDIYYVTIPHIFLYPFYVQSYCTSIAVSLEIYFEETECYGEGFKIYKNLVSRENENLTFAEYVTGAGLSSPFEEKYLKLIADKIHYRLLGSHYYSDMQGDCNET